MSATPSNPPDVEDPAWRSAAELGGTKYCPHRVDSLRWSADELHAHALSFVTGLRSRRDSSRLAEFMRFRQLGRYGISFSKEENWR